MDNQAVSPEIASSTIDAWLDYKKVNEKKRESNASMIETLVDAVESGALVLDEENGHKLIHTLQFPIGIDGAVLSLVYKPRLAIGLVHRHLKGIKSDDADGRLMAYVAALTDQSTKTLGGIDSEDYSIAQSIAVFFL